ncbi:hypothetical protein [Pseudomonas fluorescens]|uniref:hypothetical protein n=1 Tax=Pseudomonas fluorescens TaxID=294 RepID=UPI003808D06C
MLLIDPYIFLPAKGRPYSAERANEVKASLKSILSINRNLKYDLIVDQAHWKDIEKRHIRNLTDTANDPELNVALSTLRKIIKKIDTTTTEHIHAWGIKPLYFNFASKEDEEFGDYIARSVVYCIIQYGQANLFVEEISGRNILEHSSGHSSIKERSRWRIYVSRIGLNGALPVSCIYSSRNIVTPWTSRFDIFLPDTGAYSFIPPVNWHLRSTVAVATKQSKPVFLDSSGNGWANPNTPGQAYHWDVYLADPKWIAARGMDQINVTRYGAPESQGVPGTIHHVPTGKASLVKSK